MRETDARFQQLFEQIPTVAVQGYSADGTVRYWNTASERLYGYSADEAIGRNLVDLIIPPAMRAEVRVAVREMVDKGLPHAAEELQLMRKDGSLVPVYSSHVVLDGIDGERELYCLDIDLSESKRNEERLSQEHEQQIVLREMLEDVVEGGPLQETLARCLARLLAVSWLSLLPKGGIFLADEAGEALELLVSHELSPEIQTLCARVALGHCHCGRAAATREMQFSHCVDERHETRYTGMAEHGHYNLPLLSEGELLGVMVLYLPHGFERDSDKEQFLNSVAGILAGFIRRKHADEALIRLNEELEQRVAERTADLFSALQAAEQSNRAKSDFLNRMSHELRTPLNAILGFGQLLELSADDPEQADNVQEILHAGRHLLELINEVLDLARIEAGKVTISREPVSLSSLLAECLTLIGPLADERGISIIEPDQGCDRYVSADRTRLKQVLLNLLSNAVKYNREQGSVRILCAPEDATLQVRIRDTGPGLTAEQQARLFTAFERLDADRDAIEGTGIGLALSKTLVTLMDGEIGAESTLGQGSVFWVRLPASAAPENLDDPPPGQQSVPDTGVVDQSRVDVLCIEDNPANLRLIERALARREGLRLLAANAPASGLELVAVYNPSLILLDINLPDMDGYQVMDRLQADPATRDIPVVAISANAMPSDLQRGEAAGFKHYLTKPIDLERLLQVVDEIIDARGAEE